MLGIEHARVPRRHTCEGVTTEQEKENIVMADWGDLSTIGKVNMYQKSTDGKTEFNGPLSWEAFERTDAYKAMPKNQRDELKVQFDNMDLPVGSLDKNPRLLLIESQADSTGKAFTPKHVHIGFPYEFKQAGFDQTVRFDMHRSMNLEDGKTSREYVPTLINGDGSLPREWADDILVKYGRKAPDESDDDPRKKKPVFKPVTDQRFLLNSYQKTSDGKTEFNGPLTWEAFVKTDTYKAMPKDRQDELKSQFDHQQQIDEANHRAWKEKVKTTRNYNREHLLVIQGEADTAGKTFTPKRIHFGEFYEGGSQITFEHLQEKQYHSRLDLRRSFNIENGKTSDLGTMRVNRERGDRGGDIESPPTKASQIIGQENADSIKKRINDAEAANKLSHAPSDVGKAALSALAKSAGVDGVQAAYAPDTHSGEPLASPVTPGGASGKPRTV
jgi:hypothetical protein